MQRAQFHVIEFALTANMIHSAAIVSGEPAANVHELSSNCSNCNSCNCCNCCKSNDEKPIILAGGFCLVEFARVKFAPATPRLCSNNGRAGDQRRRLGGGRVSVAQLAPNRPPLVGPRRKQAPPFGRPLIR